jgi:flagellar assembly protein FliH
MNRVLRSPEISEKPFVIPANTAMELAEPAEDEGAFQELGLIEEDSGESSTDEHDQTDSSTDSDDALSGGTDGSPVNTDGPESPTSKAGGDPQEPAVEIHGPPHPDAPANVETGAGILGTSEGPISEEEGEIMIGMEEVAERDAAAATGSSIVETEQELPASASEIESIVEERLKEFEERFQQEKEDAYHAGFEDGTNEGMKQGLNQSEEEVVRFQTMVDSLTGQWKDTLRTYDTSVTDLAIRIARKIIDVEVEQNQEAVLQAVHECLAYVEDKTKVIIRVNPDDLEAVRRHRNDWLESLESIDHLLIEAEPTVLPGGCVVETPIGDVDAQIEERLERLRITLLEEINRTDDTQDA